jgi:effector-binding domain-containing protein
LAHLSVAATPAAAITATVGVADLAAWFHGAFGELHASLAVQDVDHSGPPGGSFSTAIFAEDQGEATLFIPCDLTFRPSGRIEPVVIPAAELATTIHAGSHADIDRSYGALATYVAEHALGIDGPIREYYVVDSFTTDDESRWRTTIGWPIFATLAPDR